MAGALQQVFFIPGNRTFEKVVARFTIGERVHIGQNQTFFGIGDDGVIVNRMKRLFLVFDTHQVALVAVRMDRLIGGDGHAGRIFRSDVGVVSERAEGRRNDAL